MEFFTKTTNFQISKMADSRYLGNQNCAITWPRFVRSRPNVACVHRIRPEFEFLTKIAKI